MVARGSYRYNIILERSKKNSFKNTIIFLLFPADKITIKNTKTLNNSWKILSTKRFQENLDFLISQSLKPIKNLEAFPCTFSQKNEEENPRKNY
jgi:hypothetical protein